MRYSESAPEDLVSELNRSWENGEFSIRIDGGRETLESVLKLLEVPVESQVLVFSKTSKQFTKIGPSNPRAVYFSEDCYVGWVPGGAVEVVCYGPVVGPAFYLLDPRRTKSEGGKLFTRDRECLTCHTRTSAPGTPGVMVRSVYPDRQGRPILSNGSFLTTHQSPLSERWGGWYVTGHHGTARHMGNAIAEESGSGIEMDVEDGANLDSLDRFIDPLRYPAPTSDIVALMVLEHQTAMHNVFTEAWHSLRRAKHLQDIVAEAIGEPVGGALRGSALSVAEAAAERIVHHLLFVGEASLPDGGIDGDEGFQTAFLSRRKPSEDGRSLRDFQLLSRLFKNRCSYMIHSKAFDVLPADLKAIVYRRLFDVLTDNEPVAEFIHLGRSEKMRILSILRETKNGLPGYFFPGGGE